MEKIHKEKKKTKDILELVLSKESWQVPMVRRAIGTADGKQHPGDEEEEQKPEFDYMNDLVRFFGEYSTVRFHALLLGFKKYLVKSL